MAVDFRKTSLDYNWGFIDGIMWVVENRNKVRIEDVIEMVDKILKVNDDIISEDAKRFEQLKTE